MRRKLASDVCSELQPANDLLEAELAVEQQTLRQAPANVRSNEARTGGTAGQEMLQRYYPISIAVGVAAVVAFLIGYYRKGR